MARAYPAVEPLRQREGAVSRAGLVSDIGKELDAGKKLVLVKAPAGYGKTALLRQFRDADLIDSRRRIWISLSASDSDPVQFVSRLIASYVDAAGDINVAAISLPDRLSRAPDAALSDLLTLMRAQKTGVIFVIDEYQNASNAEIDRLLKFFLQQAPENTATILAVRDEPACGAAKMRLDGDMADIGVGDLSFGVADIQQLFEGLDLSQPDIEILYDKTRGWPAALCLAKRWLLDSSSSAGDVSKFAGDLPEVAPYLAEEVFSTLPEDVRHFLQEISLLRYFDADVVDTLLQRRDSAQMLRRLENLNTFIYISDTERTRYSHHPLLADYLRGRLYAMKPPHEIEELHRMAADHFFRRGRYLFALEHAIETSDEEMIQKILDQEEFGLLWLTTDCEAFFRIMRRVEKMHPEISARLVRLLPTYAFYRMKEGDHKGAKALLRKARKLLDDPNLTALEGKSRRYAEADYMLIMATFYIFNDERESAEYIQEQMKRHSRDFGMSHPLYIGVVNNAVGVLLFRMGRIDDALEAFYNAIKQFNEADSQYGVVHNILHAAAIFMLKADMRTADNYIEEARKKCNKFFSGDYALSAVVNAARAEALYEAGEIDAVRIIASTARTAIASSRDYWVDLLENIFHIDARLQFSRNGLPAASNLLGNGLEIAELHDFRRLADFMIADRIHLAAIAGDKPLAQRLARENAWDLDTFRININDFGWRERANCFFALVRLEIALDNPDAALKALDRVDPILNRSGLERLALKAKALRALALFIDGQLQEAAALMRVLIEEGERKGLQSFFLEEGLLAQKLLDETARRFQRSKKADEFNNIVLKWLISSFSYVPSTQHIESPRLSEQQKRILKLLAKGLDRQEIASNANTTIHNVQYHLKKMFDLFGVTSSARLVAETVRLKIVDDRTARVSQQ